MTMVASIFCNVQLYADIYEIPQKQVMKNQDTKALEIKKTPLENKNKKSDIMITHEENLQRNRVVDNSLSNKKEIINKNFVEVTKGVRFEPL